MAVHPFQNFMVRYGAGERVFTEGDLGTTMYIVQSGKVRLFRMVSGEKRPYGVMEKGDFFGEMSILEGMPRTMSADAVEDVELIEINSMTFDKLIKGNIEIAIRMLRKLSIRLREAESRNEELEAAGPRRVAASRRAATSKSSSTTTTGTGVRLEAEEGGSIFTLNGSETLIGRFDPVTNQRPDVDLTGVDLKRTVSRRHARIIRTDDGFFITEEVGALNGTFVNGSKLVTGRAHSIVAGDKIALGMVKLVFHV